MAANVGEIVSDIQDWAIDTDLSDELLWSLMDEVIEDQLRNYDPWFCFNYGSVAKTAINHMNDSDLIPPAYADGVLAVDADIASGTTVPDNSEYLQAILVPDGLMKPVKVFYGSPSDNVELDAIDYEEFMSRYPHNVNGGGTEGASHYAMYNDTFLVGPTPPLAFTLSIYGVYSPSGFSANSDSNVFTTKAEALLRWGAMRKLILYNFEEDSGRFNLIDRMYRNTKNAIKMHGRNRTRRARRPRSQRAGTRRT